MDEATVDEAAERRRAGLTPWMCVALVAGLLAGARLAQLYYSAVQRERTAVGEREQLRRWETEGGAIGGVATTPPAD